MTATTQRPAVDTPVRRRPPLLRTVLGAVLRATRKAQRRTLADVAEAARISVPYLSEVERGRKEASSEVLAALSEALHVPLSRLLAETGRDLAHALAERDRLERAAAVHELRTGTNVREMRTRTSTSRTSRSTTPTVSAAVLLAA